MKLTRRQVAGVLLAAPAAPSQTPSNAAQPETPAELLAAAGERLRKNAEALAKTGLPMSTEPAFSFRAL